MKPVSLIHIGSTPGTTRVFLNDAEITAALVHYEIRYDARDLPRLVLELFYAPEPDDEVSYAVAQKLLEK